MFASRRKQHYWAYSMDCSGNEAHISSCKLGNHLNVDAEKNATCENGMPAVVSCVPGRAFAPSSHSGFRKAFRQEVSKGQGATLSGRSQRSVISHVNEAVVPGLEGWEPRSPPQLARLRASSKKAQPSRSCLSFSVQAS